MAKDRRVCEVVEELLDKFGLDEKALAEKAGVSELVVRNYRTGLNKDSRSYARFKSKTKAAFELGDEFYSDEHVWEPSAAPAPVKEVEQEKPKKVKEKKQPAAPQDPLMSAIKLSGSKAKLSGKKKDITPEAAVKWVDEYEEELKQSVGKSFDVLRESLKANFIKEETKPAFANKKVAEIAELASKAKEEDLNLIIAMLKKLV